MRIGELAARGGTTAHTVRYYERLGLLGPPARAASGYRAYEEPDLTRLKFILRARRLGLSLEEIRGLARGSDCHERQYLAQLRHQMDQCDARVAELQAFRATLEERYRFAVECEDEVREIQRGE